MILILSDFKKHALLLSHPVKQIMLLLYKQVKLGNYGTSCSLDLMTVVLAPGLLFIFLFPYTDNDRTPVYVHIRFFPWFKCCEWQSHQMLLVCTSLSHDLQT